MSRPLVTVVMPAYNAGAFITAAIESVLRQTYRPLELVVVDDGSTDDTAAAVRRLGGDLRYLHQANAGQAAARNRGVEAGRGELLAFIDADDEWMPDKLEKQVALWAKPPATGLVLCGVEEVDSAGQPIGRRAPWFRGHPCDAILLGEVGGGVCGSTFLLDRTVFEAIGRFDETLTPCEDTDLLWRVANRYPIRFVGETLVRYRLHAGNAHANLARMHAAWRRFYEKSLATDRARGRGWFFVARCRSRLNYMMAGDNARAGALVVGAAAALRAALWWPPVVVRLLSRLAARGSRRA